MRLDWDAGDKVEKWTKITLDYFCSNSEIFDLELLFDHIFISLELYFF